VRIIIVINSKYAMLEFVTILRYVLKEDHPAYVV